MLIFAAENLFSFQKKAGSPLTPGPFVLLMNNSLAKLLLVVSLISGVSPVLAGSYSQSFTGFSSGTTSLGDGSQINSNTGITQVRGTSDPYLRMTDNGTGGTSSSLKLPELDPGKAIDSFTVSFDLLIGQ